MDAVERLLSPTGSWHKSRLCWAGDYMAEGIFLPDNAPLTKDGTKFNLHSYVTNHGKNALEDSEVLEQYDKIQDYNERKKAAEGLVEKWVKTLPKKGRYIVNHTKKVCLDLEAEEGIGETWNDSTTPIVIHPLSLLTCSGNGLGGGDYNGRNMALIGSWAGDVISLEYEPMYKLNPSINFKEGKGRKGNYKFVSDEKPAKKSKATKKPEDALEFADEENIMELLG